MDRKKLLRLVSRRSVLMLYSLALAAAALAFLIPPLYSPERLIFDHDGYNSFLRIVYLNDALDDGLRYVRWIPSMARGYGYPIFHYYAPLATWLGVVIQSITGNYYLTKGMWALAILLIGGIGMFAYAMKRNAPEAAAPVAILYTFAPYHLLLTHVRGAYSEALALGLLPFLFCAAERAVERPGPRRLALAAVCVALLALTHIQSAFLYLSVFGLYFAARGAWRKERGNIAIAGLALAMGMLLSAIYWLPLLHDLQYVQIQSATRNDLSYATHFVFPYQLFERSWGWGYSVPGPDDAMSFQLGWVHLLLIALSFVPWAFRTHRKTMAWPAFWQAILLFCAYLMFESSAWIWRLVRPLQYLQFPWRLLALAAFSASALTIDLFRRIEPRWRLAAGGIVVFATLWLYGPYAKAIYDTHSLPKENLTTRILQTHPEDSFTTTMYKDEFLPVDVETFPDQPANSIYKAPASLTVIDMKRKGMTWEFFVKSDARSQIIFHQFWFPAWKAAIDGEPVKTMPAPTSGLITFDIPKEAAQITITYDNTIMGRIGAWISIAALTGLILMLLTPLILKLRR